MIDRRSSLVFFLKAFKVLVLVALVSGVICYKFHLLNKLPFFDRSDEEAFFWTESAFHYRHFLSVAEGKGIPWHDREIQYLVMALASWHVSQLYLSLFMGGFAVVCAILGREALPRKGPLAFVPVLVIAALAGQGRKN